MYVDSVVDDHNGHIYSEFPSRHLSKGTYEDD